MLLLKGLSPSFIRLYVLRVVSHWEGIFIPISGTLCLLLTEHISLSRSLIVVCFPTVSKLSQCAMSWICLFPA